MHYIQSPTKLHSKISHSFAKTWNVNPTWSHLYVVNLLWIKRFQKIQKWFDHFYNLLPHIFVQNEDLNLKWVKSFKLVRKSHYLNFHDHYECNYCRQGIWQQPRTPLLIHHTLIHTRFKWNVMAFIISCTWVLNILS